LDWGENVWRFEGVYLRGNCEESDIVLIKVYIVNLWGKFIEVWIDVMVEGIFNLKKIYIMKVYKFTLVFKNIWIRVRVSSRVMVNINGWGRLR